MARHDARAGPAPRGPGVDASPSAPCRALREVSLRAARPARCTRWSARTAPASPRWSRSWPACTGPDAGTIELDGAPVRFDGPRDALAAGIAVIHQEPTPVPRPDGRGERLHGPPAARRGCGRIDRAAMRARPPSCFDRLGVPIDPDRAGPRAVHRRPADRRDRQGAVARRPGDRDGRADRRTVRRWRWSGCSRWPARCAEDGAALLFISHRFDEMYALCQRVTVLRDGALVSTAPMADLTADDAGAQHGRPRAVEHAVPRARRPSRARSRWW